MTAHASEGLVLACLQYFLVCSCSAQYCSCVAQTSKHNAVHVPHPQALLFYLQDIVKDKKLTMRGIVGIYAANAVGDDIEVYTDDTRAEVLCR